MSSLEKSSVPSFRLTLPEIMLILVGMVGFAAFFLFLPREHPDSTVSTDLTPEEVIDRARTHLAAEGFILDGAEATAFLRRNEEILQDLQAKYGRRGTVRLLDTTSVAMPAAYRWEVTFSHRESEKDEDAPLADLERFMTVSLTTGGRVYAFENQLTRLEGTAQRYGSASAAINRSALARALVADTADVNRIRTRLRSVPDTTLRSRIDIDISGASVTASRTADAHIDRLLASETVTLDSAAVARMAELHLERLPWDGIPVRLDSISVRSVTGGRYAAVRFAAVDSVFGQVLETRLDITRTGNVRDLGVFVNEDREVNYQPAASEILSIVRIGGWGMLALVIIIVFFRRMIARVIDVKSAMLDSVLLGLVFGGVAALSLNQFLSEQADMAIWLNILLRLVALSVVGGAVALLAFMVSGVGDSIGREAFPRKMRSLSLMRHGDYRNQPVGAVLVRGIALGGALLGLLILLLNVQPDLALDLRDSFASDRYVRLVLAGIFINVTVGFLLVIMVLVGIGGASTLILDGAWMFALAVGASSAVLQIIPIDLISGWWSVLFSGIYGLALAGIFLRYDVTTAFVAFVTARLLISTSEGFLVTGSTAGIDLLLVVLFLVTLIVIGAIGLASGRTERELQQYVPEYVTEMASQERVKRELELAHQVQASFLPRTMPRIEGVDLAGMCLPANEVGGDYFDFIQLDDRRLAFVVGDVSGKGIHAAFFMTLVKGMLQTISRDTDSPAHVMRRLNHLFCLNAPSGVFISMIYGIVDSKTGKFQFARAGHNPAILCRAQSQKAEFLQPKGMAIGFADGHRFDSNIEEATMTLDPGDALVFYTDGFSEAMNKQRQLYGDERLSDKLAQVGGRSSNAVLRALTEDVHHFIEGAGRSDDMTMVVLKLNPQTA